MTRFVLTTLVLATLVAPQAGAGVIEGAGDLPTGPAVGGEDINVPEGRVRLECWQHGQKIIDEPDLLISSMSLANQANSLGFLRSEDGGDGGVLFTQIWTACLLSPPR